MKKPTSIKLDEDLKMKLKSSAKKDGRTLHGYILQVLKLSQQAKTDTTQTPLWSNYLKQ
jgi:predicted DNA-binding protein